MNQQKFDQMYRGLTVQAKKVYDAMPIAETWTPSQVMQELHRRNQSMSDMHVVMGCVNSLIACGLVVEPIKGVFKRDVIRPPCEVKEKTIVTAKESQVKQIESTPAKTGGAMEMLGQFASKLRALANEAEIIAMDIAGQAEKDDAETAKMRQVQALLKSLVG